MPARPGTPSSLREPLLSPPVVPEGAPLVSLPGGGSAPVAGMAPAEREWRAIRTAPRTVAARTLPAIRCVPPRRTSTAAGSRPTADPGATGSGSLRRATTRYGVAIPSTISATATPNARPPNRSAPMSSTSRTGKFCRLPAHRPIRNPTGDSPAGGHSRSLIEPHRLIRATLENSARRRAWVKSRDESQRNTIDAAVPSGRVQTRAAARLS